MMTAGTSIKIWKQIDLSIPEVTPNTKQNNLKPPTVIKIRDGLF